MIKVGQKVKHNITDKALLDEMLDYVDLEMFAGVLEVFEVDNKSDFNVLVGYDYEKALWLKESEVVNA